MVNKKQIKEAKVIILDEIKDDLVKYGRSIVRGLGTFKVVKHKAKVNNLGKIPARNLVKFSATREVREIVNKK